MVTGGCHCGAIRYQAEGEARTHALCHCRDCRRHAGAPMVGWTMYPQGAVKVTKVVAAWPATFLPRLRHRAVLHQCANAAGDHRYPERDLRRSRRRPGAGAHQVAERIGWMARAHELPAFERYPPRG